MDYIPKVSDDLQNYFQDKSIDIDDYCIIGYAKTKSTRCLDFSKKVMLVLQMNDRRRKINGACFPKRTTSFDDRSYLKRRREQKQAIRPRKKSRRQNRQVQPHVRRKSECDLDRLYKSKQQSIKINRNTKT